MEKRVLILINKTAGVGKAGSYTLDVVTRFAKAGYEPVVFPILPEDDLTSETIIYQYDGRVDAILCSGGDGTLNHVVNAIMRMCNKPILSYIPAGSTNDFAKGLGIPGVRARAIDVAIDGKPFKYDVGKMNGTYFNYVAAFGVFSKVSYATDQELKNVLGYAAYILSAIAELPQNIGYSCHMEIEADGVKESGDYVFGAVSNSSSVAGMTLFGDEQIQQDDGQMELILIHAPKNLAEFNSIISALAMKMPDNPYLTYKQVKHVTFKASEDVEWTLDGEFGGSYKETEVSVIEKAITIRTNNI